MADFAGFTERVTVMNGLKILNIHPFSQALAMWTFLFLFVPQLGWAVGTTAGTSISSIVTVSYDIDGTNQTPVSSSATTIKVDELIHPTLVWQDGTPVNVNTPGSNDALTFLLTNSGNGQEAFGLTRSNGPTPLPSGNYTPMNGSIGSIYLENGLSPGFQGTGPNADTIYVPGGNDPDLTPGSSQNIYVISDTPNVASDAHGEIRLTATSLTTGAAGAAPGSSFAGLGQGGGYAVVGSTRAQAETTGSYIASGLGVMVHKTVINILDPNGTAVLMPGAVITYQISVTLSGTGTATNLLITDPLPANTTYVPGSIIVGGIGKTDAADTDEAQFISTSNTVSVSLGNVAAPANLFFTVRATIN